MKNKLIKSILIFVAWAIPVLLLAWFAYTLIQNTKTQPQEKNQEIQITVNFNNKPVDGTETVETTRQVPVTCPFSGETKTSEVKTVVKTTKSEPSERRVVITEDAFKETMRQVAYKAHKEAQNEYDKSFSTLLTILTIFGIAWPVIIALLQFKFNEKEIKKIDDADETVKKAISFAEVATEQATEAAKLTNEAVAEVDNVRNNVIELNKTIKNLNQQIASSLEGIMTICAINFHAANNTEDEVVNLHNFVVGFDNTINCYANCDDAEKVSEIIQMFFKVMDEAKKREKVFENTLRLLKSDATKDEKFCCGSKVKNLLGPKNIELYRKYREFFIDLYPWKFDGDGEPNEN